MNPEPSAINDKIALAKIRFHLAALRFYSAEPAAEAQLARTIQAACVSLTHADYVLASFDHDCPTPGQIKDLARDTRDRFLPKKPSQVEQWEKEYGPPDTSFKNELLKKAVPLSTAERKAKFQADMLESKIEALKMAVYYDTPAGQAELDDIKGRKEREHSKTFWAQALTHDIRDYPEQIEAIRAGREPVFLDSRPKPIPAPRRVTAESFRNIEPMYVNRCHNCGGSGRLAADDYCNECQTGRDLRKLETSYGGDDDYGLSSVH